MMAVCGSSPDSSDVQEPAREQGDPEDRGHRQDVDEGAPEDQLDVHQAVLDHRVGQGEGDEGERDVAGELHGEARLPAEREGDRVEGEEGDHAGARAPDQPLHLAPGRDLARAPVRVAQDDEGEAEERAEVEGAEAVEAFAAAAHRPRVPWLAEKRRALATAAPVSTRAGR